MESQPHRVHCEQGLSIRRRQATKRVLYPIAITKKGKDLAADLDSNSERLERDTSPT